MTLISKNYNSNGCPLVVFFDSVGTLSIEPININNKNSGFKIVAIDSNKKITLCLVNQLVEIHEYVIDNLIELSKVPNATIVLNWFDATTLDNLTDFISFFDQKIETF